MLKAISFTTKGRIYAGFSAIDFIVFILEKFMHFLSGLGQWVTNPRPQLATRWEANPP